MAKKPPLMTQEESYAVGWDDEIVDSYPNASLMQLASRMQLIRWHRFLREPRTPGEIQFVEKLIGQLEQTCPKVQPIGQSKPSAAEALEGLLNVLGSPEESGAALPKVKVDKASKK